MKQFTITDTTYDVPTSLKEISWKQFVEFKNIVNNDADSTFIKMAKLVTLFVNGFNYEDVSASEPHVILSMYEALSFLFEDMELGTAEKQEVVTVGDESFILHDLSESFLEFSTYAQIESAYRKQPLEAVPVQLANILRKPGESIRDITPELLAQRIELFSELSADTVLRIKNFFLFRQTVIQNGTLAFSQLQQLTHQLKETTPESLLGFTAGSEPLPIWRKTLLKWILYLTRKQIQSYGI